MAAVETMALRGTPTAHISKSHHTVARCSPALSSRGRHSAVSAPRRSALAASLRIAPCTKLNVKSFRGPKTSLGRGTRQLYIQAVAGQNAEPAGLAPDAPVPAKDRGSLSQVGYNTLAIVVIAAVVGTTFFFNRESIATPGGLAAFMLIFASEIGDKTFFIAALLAMRMNKLLVFLGSSLALTIMTFISVSMGRAFKAVPDSLAYSWPLGKFAAVVLFVYFGIKMLKESYGTEPNAEGEEFNDANEVVTKSGERRPTWWAKWATPIATLLETFTLIFIAEWGDRSMFAIITLSAAATSAQSVFFGALGGHFAATAIAVIAGTLMAKYLSERMMGMIGGWLFLLFAALTAMGI
mmetsp:Transcript_5066/g.18433  ORF Transcript_5066/g.18433 Transcript_5066/m.18433 type:complete len:352 (-) Transcript_5066:155-1210(-)